MERNLDRRRGLTGRVAFKARYVCQAEGLHHPQCPGRSSTWAHGPRGEPPWSEYDKHHKFKRAWGGLDTLDNLLWVWHKCHNRIHRNEDKAVRLGLLDLPPEGAALIGARTTEGKDE